MKEGVPPSKDMLEKSLLKKGSVYSSLFLKEVNNKSSDISDRNDYINELFLYFIVPLYEKVYQLKFSGQQNLESLQLEQWLYFALRRATRKKIPPLELLSSYIKTSLSLIYILLVSLLYILVLPAYILVSFKSESRHVRSESIAVIRSTATYSKISFLEKEGVLFYFDSFAFQEEQNGASLYSAPILVRFMGLFVIPWLGLKDFISLFLTARKHLGFLSSVKVLAYYKKRIAHKVSFEFYLNYLLRRLKPKKFYTGNKEDRFALIENRLCEASYIKCICMPHGLEYAFRMPAGLVGDVFYCNSQNAKDYLSELYKDSKTHFFFDINIVEKMLSKHVLEEKEKKVVFFPESREPEKNLSIIKFLKESNINFYLKLHAKDSIENYRPFVDKSFLIDDFNTGITNSIILARKSTILLEAIYNHSIPIAVLVDDQDRAYVEFMFPSLDDEKILKVYSFDELKNLIEELREENV